MKQTLTGSSVNPYMAPRSLPPSSSFPAKLIIATEILARVTAVCSHAKKVRSLAKKTLGSTLMGTLRCLSLFDSGELSEPVIRDRSEPKNPLFSFTPSPPQLPFLLTLLLPPRLATGLD
eukprot:CAMPEP_0182508216 /NCGR_PEP_ID=MMETSP1321-20130603/24581_1 /TAXON_ID=91990 /ORGANISM="Bolidomonas sp., Strain RCC1657" /LENGTH=118 /DNA_ID=CAMNT_0024714255 /DNA_START=101 /DNA_END=457 /DNA_ORIENTATION=-